MELTAQKRTVFGKNVKDLRAKGLIPAELYGHGLKNEHLTVTLKEFRKVFRAAGESTMINLVLDSKKLPVLIHEVTVDPVSDALNTIDFYQVRLDEKMKIKVPLIFDGESSAVKEKQGVLVKAVSEIEIEAFPADIPHDIKIDITKLTDIGQSVKVGDLVIPANVKVLIDLETVVATVSARITEEEEAKMAATTDVAEIKSEVEEKKEERAAAKEEGEKGAPEAGAPAAPAAKK